MRTIYLDNGATSFPKAPGVGAAMARYIDEIGANIGRGTYPQAVEAETVVLETRIQLAKLFHFGGPETHVIFTPGATAGLNLILRGFLQPGDHVIISSLEHNAVMRPLMDLAACGVTFSRIPAGSDGTTDPAALLPLIRPNTKLVLVSHASNVSGTLFPLAETAVLCREKGLPLAVDAAQTAGHFPIDFDALRLAALCIPGHKGLLGPQGIGAVILNEEFARHLSPLISGGTGSASDREQQPLFLPDKYESGTQNLPGIFGLHAALEYLSQYGVDTFQERESHLTALLLNGLSGLPLRVVGTGDLRHRVGVVSLDFTGMDNAVLAFRMESQYGILTRCGLHCAPAAHRTLGTFPQGTVRLSLGATTAEEEVEYTVEAIRTVCGK